MTIATLLATKWPRLTDVQQQAVLDFIDTLDPSAKQRPAAPLRLYGLFAGHVTTEADIAEARKEMWGNYPRDDF